MSAFSPYTSLTRDLSNLFGFSHVFCIYASFSALQKFWYENAKYKKIIETYNLFWKVLIKNDDYKMKQININ